MVVDQGVNPVGHPEGMGELSPRSLHWVHEVPLTPGGLQLSQKPEAS